MSNGDQAWKDKVEVQRRKQGLEQPPESAPQKAPPAKPVGFKAKWANYWYHYKAVTWLCLIFVVILAVGTAQLLSRPHYDLNIILATKDVYITDDEQEYLIEKLKPMVRDTNGDGEVKISINKISGVGTDAAASQKLMVNMQVNDCALLILDDALYTSTFQQEADALVNLEERCGANRQIKTPYRFSLKGSTVLSAANQEDALNNLSICVRDLEKTAPNQKESTELCVQAMEILTKLTAANQ